MNKLMFMILIPAFALSCVGKHKSDAQQVTISTPSIPDPATEADTLDVDIHLSQIKWTVTEMRGTIRRTGKIQFQDGYFLIKNGALAGGKFTVAMKTMDITDIPAHETIARRNLINHLKSDDFFAVSSFPVSVLEITQVKELLNDSLQLTANLSIRDVTRSIVFKASGKENVFATRFTFDRFQWGIAYKGSWAGKTLIDKDIELDIKVIAE